ncbi:MAG: isoamylase early set domain-containing protein [Phycisphaerae bacterium]|jgi:1,4-alpha-glucan branching enzyme
MVTVHGNYVQFSFFRAAASSVSLVGDFNKWQAGQLMMIPDGHGYWLATMRLPAGTFRFRYYSDGQWFTDYAAFGVEHATDNQFNSVVRVDAKEEESASAAAKVESIISLDHYRAASGWSGKAVG